MTDLTPDDAAAARGVRATVDGLSAAQPQVTDWPASVRREVARRQARRTAAAASGALALAVLLVGTAAALSGGPDELVARPAAQPSASPTPTTGPSASPPPPSPEPAPAVTTAVTSGASPAATRAPVAATPPAAPEQPSPAAQKLPSCGPAPAPTDGDVVLALRFPERVDPSTAGVLRVTNRGQQPVTVTLADDETAFAVRDGQIVSTRARNSMGKAATTLAPRESREVRVRVFSYLCDGNFDRRLPQGSYQVQSTLWLNQTTQAVSPPVQIDYAGSQ